MAIKIQTRQTGIPVEIGDKTFYFETSDENIKNLRKNYQQVIKELEAIEKDVEEMSDEDTLEATKDVLRKGYELFLGKGSFDEIYAMSPSVTNMSYYFIQIAEGIQEELEKMTTETQKEKIDRYLAKKNGKKAGKRAGK